MKVFASSFLFTNIYIYENRGPHITGTDRPWGRSRLMDKILIRGMRKHILNSVQTSISYVVVERIADILVLVKKAFSKTKIEESKVSTFKIQVQIVSRGYILSRRMH